MDKVTLRHELKQRLMRLSRQEIADKSKQICEHLMNSPVYQNASVVMMFLSMPHEVDTTPLILCAWQQGKTVAVPKMSWEQRHMIPVEITSLESGLRVEKMGIRNPINGMPVPFDEIDLVVTPGLGFDKQGNRLGRGGAYYDTFFKNNKIKAAKWGVAFGEQLCDKIIHDDDDVPVDAIVTESGSIICR